MSINIETNVKQVLKHFQHQAEQSEKAINATTNDLKRRAPAWVAGEVVKVYAIKKAEINPTKASKAKGIKSSGSIRTTGKSLDTFSISYTGRALTASHFKMKPTERPRAKTTADGKRRRAKPYRVTAEILKGQRKALGTNVFLGGANGPDSQVIAWKRKGSRTDIEPVKTVSIAHMVSSERTQESISEQLGKGARERLEHNTRRFMQK